MAERELRAFLERLYQWAQDEEASGDGWNLGAHVVDIAVTTLRDEPARSWVQRFKNGEPVPGDITVVR